MSNYHRFYVKTETPALVIEKIKSACGDEFSLRSIKIATAGDDLVPEREEYGSPITTTEETGWYLLEADSDYDSDEAKSLARALISSDNIDVVAEDNEVGAEHKNSSATVVDENHWFFK